MRSGQWVLLYRYWLLPLPVSFLVKSLLSSVTYVSPVSPPPEGYSASPPPLLFHPQPECCHLLCHSLRWANNGGRKWKGGRIPTASINFITAHDGFTLADLVSYNEKHNDANGEGNRDGESHNGSWNCGEEGETHKWDVKVGSISPFWPLDSPRLLF